MSNISRIKNYIDGHDLDDFAGKRFEDINPATRKVIATADEAPADHYDAAVTAARRALKGPLGKLTIDQRAKLLNNVADEIEANFGAFVAAEVADTGKPVELASHLVIPRGAANFRVFADILKHHPTETFPIVTPDGGEAINYSLRAPKGVIAVVCPWNLQLLLMTWKVAPSRLIPSRKTPSGASNTVEPNV